MERRKKRVFPIDSKIPSFLILGTVFLVSFFDAHTSYSAEPLAIKVPFTETTARNRIQAHLKFLTSPELQGRRFVGSQKTAAYLEQQFKALELKPAFDEGKTFYQSIPNQELPLQPNRNANELPTKFLGTNVAAILKGSDPTLANEVIVISAHFDHLGAIDGVLYPGADDNASGVSLVLETARYFASLPTSPKRSLCFIGFDLEEVGLVGSRYFAEHLPFPKQQLKLLITADMVGRNGGGMTQDFLFIAGTEYTSSLRKTFADANTQQLKLGYLGADLVGERSDFAPFWKEKIPFLFLSTGLHPDYHAPTDTMEKIDLQKVEKVTNLLTTFLLATANSESLPAWQDQTDIGVEEVKMAHQVLGNILEKTKHLKGKSTERLLLKQAHNALQVILDRGSLTSDERASLISLCKFVLKSAAPGLIQ